MSLVGSAASVTVSDIEALQAGMECFTNAAEATTFAAAVNAGTLTVNGIANQYFINMSAFTVAAMLDDSLMHGGVPTAGKLLNPSSIANELQNLTFATNAAGGAIVSAAQSGVNLALKIGTNQVTTAAEVVAVGIAAGDGTQNNFIPNFVTGQSVSQFAVLASVAIFGNASLAQVITGYVNNWLNFYNGVGAGAVQPGLNATSQSYAAAFGDAVGLYIQNTATFGTFNSKLAFNALVNNALVLDGVPGSAYTPGVALVLQQVPQQLQGGSSNTFTLTVGVDAGPAFTTSVPGAIFIAAPGANPPLGTTNTLNSGDNLQDSANDGTLNLTQVKSTGVGSNPANASGVTMNGISDANILNLAATTGGFNGNITGLLNVTLMNGSNAGEELGNANFGLNTALQKVTLQADQDFTAWMTNAALAGAKSVTVDLEVGVVGGYNSEVEFNNSDGGANTYNTIAVVSGGLFANNLDLDATAPTIKVSGGQHLTMTGAALDTGPLVTFDASASTGGVTAEFFGTGSATVIGGSGADNFTFDASVGNINVSGGAGNDTFTFLSTKGGSATFGLGDSADGGPGTDLLRIQADNGEILKGGTITTIERVEHITNNPANGDFTAEINNLGSATALTLDGNYNGHTVTVNDLTDGVTIQYGGVQLGNLFLHHVGVIGTDHLQMLGASMTALHTDIDVGLTVDSIGNTNSILDVSDVKSNVVVTGNTLLTFGTVAGPYSFATGIIDASTDTGGVSTVFAGGDSLTFLGGFGNDFVRLNGNAGDLVNFQNGGNDTVQFEQANSSIQQLGNNNYQHVINWSNDIINLDAPFSSGLTSPPLDYTDTGNQVNGGDATNIDVYDAGSIINLSGSHINFIKAADAVAAPGTTNSQQGFAASIGAGSIVTNNGTNSVVWSYFDSTHNQMVLGAVDVPTGGGGSVGVITATDKFDVIATIGMSQADYNAFTVANLHFV